MKTFKASDDLDHTSLQSCVKALRDGKIVCYPTETYYALGINPFDVLAKNRLYAVKARKAEKQLPLIAANTDMVSRFCRVDDPRFQALSSRFWPGPLTLVLPSLDGRANYAIRVSSHPFARILSHAFDAPIVSTSANLSGEEPLSDPQKLHPVIQDEIDILIDAGICKGGAPSSIVSLLEDPPRILRLGSIGPEEILAAL